jgi:hypothetical protein
MEHEHHYHKPTVTLAELTQKSLENELWSERDDKKFVEWFTEHFRNESWSWQGFNMAKTAWLAALKLERKT